MNIKANLSGSYYANTNNEKTSTNIKRSALFLALDDLLISSRCGATRSLRFRSHAKISWNISTVLWIIFLNEFSHRWSVSREELNFMQMSISDESIFIQFKTGRLHMVAYLLRYRQELASDQLSGTKCNHIRKYGADLKGYKRNKSFFSGKIYYRATIICFFLCIIQLRKRFTTKSKDSEIRLCENGKYVHTIHLKKKWNMSRKIVKLHRAHSTLLSGSIHRNI